MAGTVSARILPEATKWMVEPDRCPLRPEREGWGNVGAGPLCMQHTDLYGTRKCRYYISLRAGWDTTLPVVAAAEARSALQLADGRSRLCYVMCAEAHDEHPSPGC